MRMVLGTVALVVATGCLTPRSMVLGQTAAPLGKGGAEVGVFTGVFYGSQVLPPTTRNAPVTNDPFTDQQQVRGFSLPAAEANLLFGLDDAFAMNVHLSPAGVQPGIKWTVNKSRIAHFALLPSIGLGYASVADTTYSAGVDGRQTENNPGYTTSFTFTTGLKALVSHRSGFFAGVGYDLLFNRSFSPRIEGVGAVQQKTEVTTQVVQHQITASVGMDIVLGQLHLRPEVAFAVAPATSRSISTRVETTQTDFSSSGGFTWAIFPGFSFAVGSAGKARAAGDDEGEARPDDDTNAFGDDDEAPRRRSGDDEAGDDEGPRRPSGGDDEPLRRRRPPREDDEN